jgi:uncharacterized protein
MMPKHFTYCITTACNLRCKYCYERFKPYQPMPALEEVGLKLLELANGGGSIHFFGGEPLLAFDLIKELVLEGEKRNITFGITSNLTLIDEEKAAFIKEHKIRLLASVDGVKEAHDLNRVDAQGEGTWERCIAALKLFEGYDKVTIRGSFSTETVSYLFESYRFFLERGWRDVVILPVYEGNWNEEVLKAYKDELIKLAQYWLFRREQGSPVKIRQIEEALDWVRKPPPRTRRPCGLGDRALAVMPDGTFRPCHRLCTVEPFPEEWILGDVFHGVDEEKLRKSTEWDERKIHSQAGYDCSLCPVMYFCTGLCPSANWQSTGSRYEVLKSVCDTRLVEYEVGALVHGILKNSRGPRGQGTR